MSAANSALTVLILIAMAAILKPIAVKLHLPYPPLLVIAGFISTEVLVSLGIDTGLRWHNFHDLVYFVLLPILIYEIAFHLKADRFLNTLLITLILAFPLMLISVVLTAIVLYFGINHAGFPFIAALIAAALITANDPASVAYSTKTLAIPPHLTSLLKGESLFNSMLALVLVTLALSVELADSSTAQALSLREGFILFVQFFTGGVLTGLICGLLGWLLLRFSYLPLLRSIFSVIIAYTTFLLAETVLNTSGIVAVLVAGLILNAYSQLTDTASCYYLNALWKQLADKAGIALFLLLGIAIYPPLLINQWLAVLLGISAMLLARAVIIYGGLSVLGRFSDHPTTRRGKNTLFSGGMKGGVTIALAFSLPASLSYSDTIQAIIYGVVLFSLFIQMPMLRFWANRT